MGAGLAAIYSILKVVARKTMEDESIDDDNPYIRCGVNNDLAKWICKQRCFDYVMITYNVAEARRNGLINDLYNCGIGVISGASLNRSINSIHFPHNKKDLWYMARTFLKYRGEVKRAKKYSFIKNIEGMSPQQKVESLLRILFAFF